MQTITKIAGDAAVAMYEQLSSQGVKTVLHRQSGTTGPRLSWLLTARHRIDDICHAVHILAAAYDRESVGMIGGLSIRQC